MISASKSTLSLNDLKILRPKVTQKICVRSFVNPHIELLIQVVEGQPKVWYLNQGKKMMDGHYYAEENITQLQ